LLQHEYGIYGGKWANFRIKGMDYRTPTGNYLLDLLEGVNAPIITTLHTVLPHLDAERSKVLAEIAARSCKIILMTEQSKGVIIHQWPAIARKTTFIPHGVELKEKNEARSKILKRLKLPDDKFYLMVSGLIGPNKNIEAIIKTLPDLVAEYPQIQLLVVGQTHPQIIKNAGEQYRKSLKKLARDLGVSQHVRFVNKYISSELLLDYLAISDVYLTIHNDPEQSASGTLAYAVGNGLVSISTPYAYARELLSKNRGLLVPFNNSEAIGAAIILLITNQRLYKTIRLNATKYGKEMGWDRVAEAYWKIIDDALPKSV
jgi:glycosyltransferase involved in cell wall biosynthesis